MKAEESDVAKVFADLYPELGEDPHARQAHTERDAAQTLDGILHRIARGGTTP